MSLSVPPVPPDFVDEVLTLLDGFASTEQVILKASVLEMLKNAADYKPTGRSGRVMPEVRIQRGRVRGASTSRTMDVTEER